MKNTRYIVLLLWFLDIWIPKQNKATLYYVTTNGNVRIVGYSEDCSSGIIQFYNDKEWGTLADCDLDFNDIAAETVCNTLGFINGYETHFSGYIEYGEDLSNTSTTYSYNGITCGTTDGDYICENCTLQYNDLECNNINDEQIRQLYEPYVECTVNGASKAIYPCRNFTTIQEIWDYDDLMIEASNIFLLITDEPTQSPTLSPTKLPTTNYTITMEPTISPTKRDTTKPTDAPVASPTDMPTLSPTTYAPTYAPTIIFGGVVLIDCDGDDNSKSNDVDASESEQILTYIIYAGIGVGVLFIIICVIWIYQIVEREKKNKSNVNSTNNSYHYNYGNNKNNNQSLPKSSRQEKEWSNIISPQVANQNSYNQAAMKKSVPPRPQQPLPQPPKPKNGFNNGAKRPPPPRSGGYKY